MSDIEAIREVLAYNPGTGVLTRLVGGRGRAGGAGAEVGTPHIGGYRQVMVNGKRYQAHRLAWALTHGTWPAGDIDHINGVKDDNRISNLRDVPHKTNTQNLKRARRDSRSGSAVQGVSWNKGAGKFQVNAKRDGKTIYLGLFSRLADAEATSLAYRREHYAGFTL